MFGKFRDKLVRFWRSDRGLSAFLVLLILSTLVLPPITTVWELGDVVNDIAFSLLLIGGIVAASERPRMMATMSLVIAAALILRWASWFMASTVLAQLEALFLCLSFGMLALVILGQVFRDGPITSHRIQGAIAVYLLLGLAWAAAYELVELRHRGAFAGSFTGAQVEQAWLYFSYATLSTVGYGDIVPVHAFARSLAVLEALVGQLYPAILIARLVSQEVQDRSSRHGEREG